MGMRECSASERWKRFTRLRIYCDPSPQFHFSHSLRHESFRLSKIRAEQWAATRGVAAAETSHQLFGGELQVKNNRTQLVMSLSEEFPVDSMGSCLNNAQWPQDVGANDKMGALQTCALNLAFENQIFGEFRLRKSLRNARLRGRADIFRRP
eukprot:Selendium_serpulae@DN8173_c0_g1_i1.p1